MKRIQICGNWNDMEDQRNYDKNDNDHADNIWCRRDEICCRWKVLMLLTMETWWESFDRQAGGFLYAKMNMLANIMKEHVVLKKDPSLRFS